MKNLSNERMISIARSMCLLHHNELRLKLIAGDAVPTDAVMEVDSDTGELKVIKKQPGDGIVLRSSALLDERIGNEWRPTLKSPIKWEDVTFLFTDHLGLTRDPVFYRQRSLLPPRTAKVERWVTRVFRNRRFIEIT